MPRVYTKTKNQGGHKVYKCSAKPCKVGNPDILPGQVYLTWKFNRGSRYFRHAACGMPRRSDLTNSKMGTVYDAVDDFDAASAESPEDIKNMLDEVAAAARSVADEYEEAAGAIMDTFPSGNPTSEACQATADELNSWADSLEGWEPHDDDDEDELLETLRQEAQELVEEQPEYQG